MEILVVVVSWLLFGGASSYFAKQRGRDPFAWFLIGMLLGILGLLLLFLLPPLIKGEQVEDVPQPQDVQESVDYSYRLKEWYYLDDQRNQVGPNSFNQLKKALAEGKIHPQTFIWSEGMVDWKRLEDLPQIKEVLL